VGFVKSPFRPAFSGAGRLLAACCLFSLFSGCQTGPPPAEVPSGEASQHRISTFPGEGWLVFTGVAAIRSRREESVHLALEEAAKKVSLFERVEGTVRSYSNTGGRFLDYRSETTSSVDYRRDDTQNIEKIEQFEYDPDSDVFQYENAVFVRVRCRGSLPLSYQAPPAGPDGKPAWVDNPPEAISGYAAGVGYAGRRNAHRDTVIASYDNAVLAIIRNQNTTVWSASEGFRGSGFLDYSAASQKDTEASGVLTGFYVLEIWADPATKAVWTLAVARPV
jgi:hypothetical protein